MHVERLEIVGYQHLAGSYEFASGLTVVTGPNESGKSTLHEALANALFGFSSADRRQRSGSSPKDLRRPWSAAPFRAVLTLVDCEDRVVRVDWDFDEDRVEVRDATTGQQLLHEQPTQRQEFTVGPLLLGLEREEHRQVSCLFQEGLAPVEASEDLRQALQRAVEATAADERGVEGADERLRGVLVRIGVQSNHYGALAGGQLRGVEQQRESLKAELERAGHGREGLDALAAQQAERSAELKLLGQREVVMRQATLRAAAQELAQAQFEATRLEESSARCAGVRTSLPADLPGRVASARDALRAARVEHVASGAGLASTTGELEALNDRRRAADADLDALAAYAEVSTDVEEEVRAALGNLRGAPSPARPLETPTPRDPLLDRFRHERTKLERAPMAPVPSRPPAAILFVVAALAVAGILVGTVVHPAAFLLVLIAAVVLVAGRGQRTMTTPTRRVLFEGRPFIELDAAVAAEDRAWIAYEAAQAEHERLVQDAASRRQDAESILRALLDVVLPGSGTPEERAVIYLQQCAHHRSWINARAQVERIAAEQRAAAEPERRHRSATEEVERAEAELRRLIGQAGVDQDDLDAGLATFDQLVMANADAQEDAEHRAAAAGRLEQLLAGRTLDELRAQAVQAQAALADHETAHGLVADEAVDADSARQLSDDRTRLAEEIAGLAARRAEREAGLGDPADLELQLHASNEEFAQLELHRDAVRIARQELEAAAREAHRRVAPHLNAALTQDLPRITRGHYSQAMVADDLTIRVVAPETGAVVEVERLSRGTRDQIALVQRLELARLLDPTGGGAPLLLDDCFAHTDDHRLPLAVELLAEVAAGRQVVLFSGDSDVVDAVRHADPAAAVIELPDAIAGDVAG